MTRQEQIEKAALDEKRVALSTYQRAFELGAKWADEHPAWISVADELPKREGDYSDFSIRVLATDGKDVDKAMLQNDGTWFTHDLWVFENVTHWMPLPSIETIINKQL